MSSLNETLPHDDDAERALLGACLASPHTAGVVAEELPPTDLYQPSHEMVLAAVVSLLSQDVAPDAVAVANELRNAGRLARAGGLPYLHTLLAAAPVASAVAYHVEIVRDLARRRALIEAADRLAAQARQPGSDVESVIDRAHKDMSGLRFGKAQGDDLSSLLDLDEFVDQPLPPVDWLIPGLLAVGDRFVLTGSEGLGKTTLVRQIAVAAAAGLHPFTLVPQPPKTVLVIDCENPIRIMRDRFSDLRTACRRRQNPVAPGRLWIDRRPEGMQLESREDQRWLAQRVEGVNPDLLVIGPAYKLYRGGGQQNEEEKARAVTAVLDEVREASGCGLLLEHHSPHAQGMGLQRSVRPIGSSLWLRWPEFGYGIRLADGDDLTLRRRLVDVEAWRGPRDERPWPTRLEMGMEGWPWMEARPV